MATPPEEKLSDSILVQRENARRIREESARIQSEQAEREKLQRDRQARHQEEARRIDEEVRARLYLLAQTREAAKPQPEVRPVPVYTERQDKELELEQAAGRRTLAKYAQRSEEKAKE